MAINWYLIADVTGAQHPHQPAAGDPLELEYNGDGQPHLPAYPKEIVYMAHAEVSGGTSGPVSVVLKPESGVTDLIDEARSNPREIAGPHDGVYTWTQAGNTTTLTFTVPSAENTHWAWRFGPDEPPLALRTRIRVKRI